MGGVAQIAATIAEPGVIGHTGTMARLRFGEAQISGQQLTVSGQAPERGVATAIHELLTQRLVKGYTGRDSIEVRTDADIAAEAEARE